MKKSPVEKHYIPTEYLGNLSISQLLGIHLDGELLPEQVRPAQEILKEQIEIGEEDLRLLYQQFTRDFFGTKRVAINSFTNYLDYLQHLYVAGLNLLPKSERREFGEAASELYDRENKFVEELRGDKLWIEVAHPAPHKGPAAFIIVRRKDTEWALEKLVRKMMLGQKRPRIRDLFGIKVVTYTAEQAHNLAYKVLYPNIKKLGLDHDSQKEPIFEPDSEREPIYRRKKIVGYQQPGMDDHDLYGRGMDTLIQIKIKKAGLYTLREMVVTDLRNALRNEKEHAFRYRQHQKYEIKSSANTKAAKKRRKILLERGKELAALLPDRRQRILVPGEDF